jgi:hypothetical protein
MIVNKVNCELVAVCAFNTVTEQITYINYDEYYKNKHNELNTNS